MTSKRVDLIGWNGKQNAGDDAMSAMFVEAILAARPDAEIQAYADRATLPRELSDAGVKGLSQFNAISQMPGLRSLAFRNWFVPRFVGRMGGDLVILGGGSILRNSSNIRHFNQIIDSTRITNPKARFVALSVSVGPFDDSGAQAQCCGLLRRLDAIAVRDKRSLELVGRLCPGIDRAYAADAALAYASKTPLRRVTTKPKTIGICLRAGEDEAIQREIVAWLGHLDPREYQLRFIAMSSHPHFDDEIISHQLAALTGHENIQIVPYRNSVSDVLEEVAECALIVAIRLHAMIFASALGVPVLFHPYHSKLMDFAHDSKLNSIAQITPDFTSLAPHDVIAPMLQKRGTRYLNGIDSSRKNGAIVARQFAK